MAKTQNAELQRLQQELIQEREKARSNLALLNRVVVMWLGFFAFLVALVGTSRMGVGQSPLISGDHVVLITLIGVSGLSVITGFVFGRAFLIEGKISNTKREIRIRGGPEPQS